MNTNTLFSDLRTRMREMPENFKGFVTNECNWSEPKYYNRLKHPENCSRAELEMILKIAHALAVDLFALISHHRKAMQQEITYNHDEIE
jgi:hypothetical protein